ncbi:ABC transporter permease [Fulvivirgaceae bacterium PWU5]|uniref:ABC transporter permease n=1 Tax=Dawidia cretensis TaxID=2782350 RepID=A0AAP2E0Y4_9BACT|nr:ABC transporter permease [Dawidia cretensis]MBT1711068.1 ABC transporter permease [Dawidia cretensis]
MIRNYFIIALRSIRKHLSYATINILGLSLGLATCILLVTWIGHELRYDRFYPRASEIYRVSLEYAAGGQASKIALSPTALLPTLTREFPEVEAGVRLSNNACVLQHGDKIFEEQRFYYADSTFFKVFGLELMAGNPDKALTQPQSVIFTQSMARKYFGSEDVVGKTLQVNGKEYQVTGLLRDQPDYTMLPYDFVASFTTLRQAHEPPIWWSANYTTYVLLRDQADVAALTNKLNERVAKEVAGDIPGEGNYVRYNFLPLPDIHLRSDMDNEQVPVGNLQYVYIFGFVALLVLVIACINYVNLATARATDRAREVGVRKVAGAVRTQLFFQFICESLVITWIALVAAFMLARLALPLFSYMTGVAFDSSLFLNPAALGVAVVFTTLLAFLAGAYPALVITGFTPVKVLKGNFKTSGKGLWLRQGLVVFQFCASIVLIVGTVVVLHQLSYIRDKKLGFDRERVVVLTADARTQEVFSALKTEIERQGVSQQIGRAMESPTLIGGGYSLHKQNGSEQEGMNVTAMAIDTGFIPTLGMELVAGRNISEGDYEQLAHDTTYAFILNENAVQQLGFDPDKAIGTPVRLNGRSGTITGIVHDFHFASLQHEIGPLVLFTEKIYRGNVFVKLKGHDIQQELATLKAICQRLTPHRPFDYHFLDQEYDALYQNEQRMGTVSTVFAILAIVIACMGLFGLVAFSAAQKTKEIGIRKVMGATVPSIVLLITKDFTRLVLIAVVVGLPLAYWLMDSWLQGFAYRVSVGAGPIVLAFFTVTLIAFVTAGVQALQAALANPVNTLRNE